MNLSSSPASSNSPSDGAGAPVDARPSRAAQDMRNAPDPRDCDAFALVLQSRQQRQQPDEDAEPAPAEGALSPPPPTPLLAQVQSPVPLSAAGAVETSTGTRAVIEASLRESACPAPTTAGGTDPAMTWEAVVSEPNAVAVQVRAVRTVHADAAAGAPATWGVTVAAPSVDAGLLARHVPRLNERLRKQGVDVDHVRVERQQDRERR